MKTLARICPILVFLAFLAGCATNDSSIAPVSIREHIKTLFVVDNPKVDVEALLPELVNQLSAMGFEVIVVDEASVPEGGYSITYSARQSGQTVKTLTYLRIEVRKGGRLLGYAFSDAENSFDRYGKTADKLRPMLQGLFEYARPERK
jgi:hypothetical protein